MAYKIIWWLKKILPWFITVFILAILFNKVDLTALDDIYYKADKLLLTFSILISIIYHFFLSVKKYQAVLDFFGLKISERETRLIKIGSMSLKAALPYKTGEFARAVYLNKNYNLPYLKGVYAIVFGYLTRLPILIIIPVSVFCLRHFNIPLAFLISFLLLVVFLSLLTKYRRLIFYSLISEILLIFNYLIVFKAFAVDISIPQFLILIPIVLIITALPISVFGIGVREFIVSHLLFSVHDFNLLFWSAFYVSIAESIIPMCLSLLFLNKFIKNIGGNAEMNNGYSYLRRRNENMLTRYRIRKRIKRVIDAILKYRKDKAISVLDIGAADGLMLDQVAKFVNLKRAIGIEPDKELMMQSKSETVKIINGKAEELPFNNGEFDVILMCSVVEHVEDIDRTLDEVYRVLVRDGIIIITSVNVFLDFIASKLGIKPDDHLRTFTLNNLKKTLENHKFKTIETKTFGPLFYNIVIAEKI